MSGATCNEEGKKDFEKYLNELGETVPKFCPNCGDELIRISKDGKIWIMPLGDMNVKDSTSLKITVFDIYCDSCEWSGDISPDSLEDYNELKKEDD